MHKTEAEKEKNDSRPPAAEEEKVEKDGESLKIKDEEVNEDSRRLPN